MTTKTLATTRQIFVSVIVNLLAICNGMSAGWTSPVQPILQQANNPLGEHAITDEDFSWASSVLYVGGFLGIFVWNQVVDRFGRKINGYLLAATQILSWCGIVTATNATHLILARFLMGIGGAGILTNSQLYINETANAAIKGRLCALIVICMNFGFLYVYGLGAVLSYTAFNLACLAVPVTFVFAFWWLPESPLFLLANGRTSEAYKVVLWLRGGDEHATMAAMSELQNIININRNVEKIPYKELLASKANAAFTVLAVVLFSGQQLCGNAVISSYTVEIFALGGDVTTMSPYVCTAVVGVLLLIMSCVSSVMVKFAGRKRLLVGAFLGACASLASLTAFFFAKSYRSLPDWTGWIPISSVIAFELCYGFGIGPVPYILMTDIFPATILNNGMSVAMMCSIALSFVTIKVFPWLIKTHGKVYTFALFTAFNLILAVVVAHLAAKCARYKKARKSTAEAKSFNFSEIIVNNKA